VALFLSGIAAGMFLGLAPARELISALRPLRGFEQLDGVAVWIT
jgi:hypothetical protein